MRSRSLADVDTPLVGAAAAALGVLGALWLVPWPASVILLLWAALAAVGWFYPGPLLALLALSVPVQASGAVRAGPVTVTLTKLVLAALVTAFALRIASGSSRITLTPPVWGYAAIIATLVVSILHVQAPGSWAGEVYRWAVAAIVLVMAQDILRDRRARSWTLAGMGAGVLASSSLAFYQVLAGVGPASFQANGAVRAFATFGEPNPFAAYLELSVPLFIALAMGAGWGIRAHRATRLLLVGSLVVTLAGTAALLLTQSRGGLLGFAAALAVIVWWSGKRFRQVSIIVGLILVITVGLTPPGHRVADRFIQGGFGVEQNVQVTTATWANQERIAHWRAGIAMMEAHPWTGVGAGQFDARYREFTKVWRFRIPRGHAHNGFIQMGAQAGVPGLIASIVFCAALLVAAWSGRRRMVDRVDRALALGVFAVIVAFCVHSVFDYLSVLSLGVQLSLVVAFAMSDRRQREPPFDRDHWLRIGEPRRLTPRAGRASRADVLTLG